VRKCTFISDCCECIAEGERGVEREGWRERGGERERDERWAAAARTDGIAEKQPISTPRVVRIWKIVRAPSCGTQYRGNDRRTTVVTQPIPGERRAPERERERVVCVCVCVCVSLTLPRNIGLDRAEISVVVEENDHHISCEE
jgi:hypothetical protein